MSVLSEWWDRLRVHGTKRVSTPTMFGEASVYVMLAEDGSLVRMLNVGDVLQSATYLDERWYVCPFAYLRSFDHLFEAMPPLAVNQVLMIGGAGFAYPKQLLVQHPGVKLDVVEIDPAVVELAREYFFLDRLETKLAEEGRDNDLRIFVEDGAAFLRANGEVNSQFTSNDAGGSNGSHRDRPLAFGYAFYDVIIVDAFVGREAVPFFSASEGIAAAKKRLSAGGLLIANCVVEYTGDAMYQLFAYVERLRKQFAHVTVIDASDEEFGGADNYLVVASDVVYPFTNTIPYSG